MQEVIINDDAIELEDRAFAKLRELVLDEARAIVRARGSAKITREDVEEALRRALHLFLERTLDLISKKRREGAVSLVESWLADKSGYDKRVWPELSQGIEQNRLSDRSRLSG
jgi:hypothetical protein